MLTDIDYAIRQLRPIVAESERVKCLPMTYTECADRAQRALDALERVKWELENNPGNSA